MKTLNYFNVVTILKDGTVLNANFDNQVEAQATMNFYVKQGNVASQSYSFYEIPVIEQAQEFHDSYASKDNIAVKVTPKEEIPDVPEKPPEVVAEEIVP